MELRSVVFMIFCSVAGMGCASTPSSDRSAEVIAEAEQTAQQMNIEAEAEQTKQEVDLEQQRKDEAAADAFLAQFDASPAPQKDYFQTLTERRAQRLEYGERGNLCSHDAQCPGTAKCMGYSNGIAFGHCECASPSGCAQ